MPSSYVPVTQGAPVFRSLELRGFRVNDAQFEPNLYLPPHQHVRASIAVMLGGSFELRVGTRSWSCTPGSFFTEPPAERHSNRMSRNGAHVVVIQPDPSNVRAMTSCGSLVESMHHTERSITLSLARRISCELAAPDDLTPWAVEGLVLDLLVSAQRSTREGPRAPAWLASVEEILRATFRDPWRIEEIAREVGVHPTHLARVFRKHHGSTIGDYVRSLRLEWAAHQLANTPSSLATIAVEAGFADQSHFTRLFKRYTGATPLAYRKSFS